MCCPCSERPASVTSLPRAQQPVRACLSPERRGRSARKWSTRRQDLGIRPAEINSISHSQVRDCHSLWHSCRGRRGRGRPPAPAALPASPAAAAMPKPRASISPASAAGARATSASPRRTSITRSSATSAAPRPISASASRRLAGARRRRGSGCRARRTPPPRRAGSSAIWPPLRSPRARRPSFPFGAMRKQANANLNKIETRGREIFVSRRPLTLCAAAGRPPDVL